MPLHTADIQGAVDKLLVKVSLQAHRKHIFFTADQSLEVGNMNPLAFLAMIYCQQGFFSLRPPAHPFSAILSYI